MADSLYFNCGELKPGLRTISIPRPPASSTLIVKPRNVIIPPFIQDEPPFEVPPVRPGGPTGPGVPGGGRPGGGRPEPSGTPTVIPIPGGPTTGRPRPDRFKCIEYRKIYCPQDLQLPVDKRRILLVEKRCVRCPPPVGNAAYPPECSYSTPTCNNDCNSINGNCEGEPPVITTGGPTTGGQPQRRWKCMTTRIVPCPDTLGIVNYTIQDCIECRPDAAGRFPAECNFTSDAQCRGQCPREIFVQDCPPVTQQTGTTGVSTGGTTGTGGTGTTGGESQTIPIVTIKPNGSINTNTQTQVSVGSTVVVPPSVGVEIPRTNDIVEIDLNTLEQNRLINNAFEKTIIPNSDSSSVYSKDFNFYQKQPATETILVDNNKYTNIFKRTVAAEVKYVLDRQNNDQEWNEAVLFDLTEDKILISLQPDLAIALKNLHYFGNQGVNSNLIVAGIKRLLLTGKIDEFDPNYFITLSKDQQSDSVVQFKNTQGQLRSERVGLGVIAEDSTPADSKRHTDTFRELIKRQKRLNTDIEANFILQDINQQDLQFDMADAGIPLIEVSGNDFVLIGDGDGYYITVQDATDQQLPLVLENKVSSTYYTSPDVRYNALTLFKQDAALTLTVSSTSSNEFTIGYDSVTIPEIMFFAVELSSVTSLPTDNSLVEKTRVNYRKLTTQKDIDYFTLNYGLAVVRANINYDDPFLYYARDTNIIQLDQLDVTFRSFDRNRTVVGENILSRNIPFGIILTAGCGSNHNPFAGFSRLESRSNDILIRSIELIPDINVNKNKVPSQPLEIDKLYTASGLTSIGLIEEKSFESAILKFNPNSYAFNNRLYKDGFQTSLVNDKEFGYGNFVKKIKYLSNTYNVDNLTWWDILRRLNLNELSKFVYDNNKEITREIVTGLLGPTVQKVLARIDPTKTFIDALDSGDKLVVSERSRLNAFHY